MATARLRPQMMRLTDAAADLSYRSKHELVFAFKVGNAGHTNTFGLGDPVSQSPALVLIVSR